MIALAVRVRWFRAVSRVAWWLVGSLRVPAGDSGGPPMALDTYTDALKWRALAKGVGLGREASVASVRGAMAGGRVGAEAFQPDDLVAEMTAAALPALIADPKPSDTPESVARLAVRFGRATAHELRTSGTFRVGVA